MSYRSSTVNWRVHWLDSTNVELTERERRRSWLGAAPNVSTPTAQRDVGGGRQCLPTINASRPPHPASVVRRRVLDSSSYSSLHVAPGRCIQACGCGGDLWAFGNGQAMSDGEREAFAIADPKICHGRHFADRFAFSTCMAYSSNAVSRRPRIAFPFTCVVGHELAGECIDLGYFSSYSYAFY
jgi:hypothetical protein